MRSRTSILVGLALAVATAGCGSDDPAPIAAPAATPAPFRLRLDGRGELSVVDAAARQVLGSWSDVDPSADELSRRLTALESLVARRATSTTPVEIEIASTTSWMVVSELFDELAAAPLRL